MSMSDFNRRAFLKTSTVGATAAAAIGSARRAVARDDETETASTPESVVKVLYESLNEDQKSQICFDWEYQHPRMGLLRTRVANNWHITRPVINSEFFSDDQRAMIRDIFEGIIQPDWHARFDQQLQDDAGGFGNDQNIAIFGTPGDGSFEFVMTGRHMTLRCDGNSADHVAFGGPIFYGHAARDFNEAPDHPGNVFWEQALEANKVYSMLDGRQREWAEVVQSPQEQDSGFQGPDGKFPGIPIEVLSADQKEVVQGVLQKLIEPYRQSDRDEVLHCLTAQGGLDACSLAFYTDHDLGDDRVFDNWRIEGPSFVWYFRGAPHVHCWVNIADSPDVRLNA